MLIRTTENNKHAHLVYITPNNQLECALTKKHRHAIELDPSTNQPTIMPADDGHTHDLMELDIQEPQPPRILENEEDILQRISTYYQEAYDAERVSIQKGQESVNFVEGNQWTENAINQLASQNRAALTINHVAPMVETLSGIARQQRTDIKILPVENGDQFAADLFTSAIKQILSQNEFDFEEIEVFEDLVIPGRGAFEVYPDYDENIEGNIKIKKVDWDMITIAPHTRKDLADAEYLFKWKWVSQNQLSNLYPEYKNEISNIFTTLPRGATNNEEDTFNRNSILLNNPLFSNPQSKQIKLLECEAKEYYNVKVWIDLNTGDTYSEDELPSKFRSQMKTLSAFKYIKRRLFRLRKTVTAGDLILEDGYMETPVLPNMNGNPFSVIVVYAYKRGMYFEGKVERMKDPQRELNKRRSQTVDIVNTTINNGWFYGEDTFKNRMEEENFKANSSTAGFAIKINDVDRPPIKVASGVVERGIVELEMNSQRSLREVTNINTELLGQAPSYQSGVAMQHQQRAALVGNEYLFDNFNRGKKELGKRLVAWIQKIYTPERIAKLVLNQATVNKVFIAGEQLDPQNQQQVEIFLQRTKQVLQNPEQLEFNVAIGEANSTPTAQLSNFQLLLQLAQSGLEIPMQTLLEYAPIPNKEQMLQQIQQQQQQQQQAETQKYQTEIQKTLIAHQGKQQS